MPSLNLPVMPNFIQGWCMKSIVRGICLTLMLVALSSHAFARLNKDFSVCLDGIVSSGDNQDFKSRFTGFGGYIYGDWRFLPFLSVGLGWGISLYQGDLRWFRTDALTLLGRIIPYHRGRHELYLIGGLGERPLRTSLEPSWRGNHHAMIGAGWRYGLKGNWSTDLGLVYNLYSPDTNWLKVAELHLGVAYRFGANVPAAKR